MPLVFTVEAICVCSKCNTASEGRGSRPSLRRHPFSSERSCELLLLSEAPHGLVKLYKKSDSLQIGLRFFCVCVCVEKYVLQQINISLDSALSSVNINLEPEVY